MWQIKCKQSCLENPDTPTHSYWLELGPAAQLVGSTQRPTVCMVKTSCGKVLIAKLLSAVITIFSAVFTIFSFLNFFRLGLCHLTPRFQRQEHLEAKIVVTVNGWLEQSLQISKTWNITLMGWYRTVRITTHFLGPGCPWLLLCKPLFKAIRSVNEMFSIGSPRISPSLPDLPLVTHLARYIRLFIIKSVKMVCFQVRLNTDWLLKKHSVFWKAQFLEKRAKPRKELSYFWRMALLQMQKKNWYSKPYEIETSSLTTRSLS